MRHMRSPMHAAVLKSMIIVMPMQESGQLVQAVTAACEVAGLQSVPALVSKCLQLQDTMAVRFGVMLVGPAGWPHAPVWVTAVAQLGSCLPSCDMLLVGLLPVRYTLHTRECRLALAPGLWVQDHAVLISFCYLRACVS